MFDFSALKLVVGAKESFVGIRKSEDLDTYEFCLPKGFDDFAKYQSDFNNVRDFFFLMYRTLRKFSQDSLYSSRFQKNDSKSQTSQDQPTLSSGGISLKTNDEEEEGSDDILLYSKLNMIERVLEAYDDLALHSIQKKIRRTEEIDYSKIHKYLDRAIYLDYSEEEHTIYIEAMDNKYDTITNFINECSSENGFQLNSIRNMGLTTFIGLFLLNNISANSPH